MRNDRAVLDLVMKTPLSADEVPNYRPDDALIAQLDRTDPSAAEVVLQERYGDIIDISFAIRDAFKMCATPLEEILGRKDVKENYSLQDWLLEAAIRKCAKNDPTFYETQLAAANDFFRQHPGENIEEPESKKDYVHNRVTDYIAVLATWAGKIE